MRSFFQYLLFLNLIIYISSAALHAEESSRSEESTRDEESTNEEPIRNEELTRILGACNSDAFEKSLVTLNFYLKNCGQPLIDYLKRNRYDEYMLEAADRCFSPNQSKLKESKYEELFCRKYIQEVFNTGTKEDQNEILEKVCSLSCKKEDASEFILVENECHCE